MVSSGMSRGLGSVEVAILAALAKRTKGGPWPSSWSPLYTPERDYIPISKQPAGRYSLYSAGLPDIEEMVQKASNARSKKVAIRRAARSLKAKGLIDVFVCGASYLVDVESGEMMSHPLTCVRFSSEGQYGRAKEVLGQYAQQKQNVERANAFREKTRKALLEKAAKKRALEDDDDLEEWKDRYSSSRNRAQDRKH